MMGERIPPTHVLLSGLQLMGKKGSDNKLQPKNHFNLNVRNAIPTYFFRIGNSE